MTCAPLGIFKMRSESVGRTATNRRPVLAAIDDPSGRPIRSSWTTMPAWVWNEVPLRRVSRYRRSLLSIRRTLSSSRRRFRSSAPATRSAAVGSGPLGRGPDEQLLSRLELRAIDHVVLVEGTLEHPDRDSDHDPRRVIAAKPPTEGLQLEEIQD